MKRVASRLPKNYDGTQVTTRRVGDLLTDVLSKVSERHHGRPDLVLAAWPDIIGPRLAGMTQAVSLRDGILTVKVKNSTLHSLLSRHDNFRILAIVQQKFPQAKIQEIRFRIA